MADQYDRVQSSYTDVLACEHVAPGMIRVVTVSDAYVVDARHEVCQCPDFEYHLDGQGRCKHLYAALRETDQLPTPEVFGYDESLTERPEPAETDGGTPQVATDGGESFEGFDHGDRLRYVGPDDFEADWAAPKERHNPHTFKHVSVGGTLTLETKHNARRRLSVDHPAHTPEYWERVETDGGCPCSLCASDDGPGCFSTDLEIQ